MKKLLITIILISTLLLAGCGSKECETRNECRDGNSCDIASCVKGVCSYTPKAGCICGNGICEDGTKGTKDLGENECGCREDCGTCDGNVGDFMEKTCIDNECITKVKTLGSESLEDTAIYEESRVQKLLLNIKADYDSPFNLKSSLFKLDIITDKMVSDISEVRITKVKIVEHTGTKDRYGKWTNDQPKTLAEKEYTKTLYSVGSEFSKSFPIILDIEEDSSEKKTITLEINYDFKKQDRYGNLVTTSGLFEKEFDMTLINPSIKPECPSPSECNDNNPCTEDSCNEGTNFFCKNEIISKGTCCGDDVCSPGEDRCRCPGDCGPCSGDIGEYMSLGCSSVNICTSKIKNINLIQPTSKLTDASLSGSQLGLTVQYDIPFDKSSSMFTFSFEPKVLADVKNFMIKKVTMLDSSGTILGQQTLNMPIIENKVSTGNAVLSYSSLNAEEKKTVSAKFDYSLEKYDSRSGEWTTTVASYTYSFGELTILHPG